MKSAVVVGGGVSGIFTALYLRKLGIETTLIEKRNELGGLFGSYEPKDGSVFDIGSHIPRETGIQTIDQLLFSNLGDDFEKFHVLKAGNYCFGQLNEQSPYIDARKLPWRLYRKGMEELCLSEAEFEAQTLEEQILKEFGPTFAENALRPAIQKLMGLHDSELLPDAIDMFYLDKLVVENPKRSRQLKKNHAFDRKIAFHDFNEQSQAHAYYYSPFKGSQAWIQHLESCLIEANIKVLKADSIQQIHTHNRSIHSLEMRYGKPIAADYFYWTAPASNLLMLAGEAFDYVASPIRRVSLFHYETDQKALTDLYQIENFDPRYQSYRIRLYDNHQLKNSAPYRISVEVLNDDVVRDTSAPEEIFTELKEMKVISDQTNCIQSWHQSIESGIPVKTRSFKEYNDSLLAQSRALFQNLCIFGRSNAEAYNLSDVLLQALDQINQSLENQEQEIQHTQNINERESEVQA